MQIHVAVRQHGRGRGQRGGLLSGRQPGQMLEEVQVIVFQNYCDRRRTNGTNKRPSRYAGSSRIASCLFSYFLNY